MPQIVNLLSELLEIEKIFFNVRFLLKLLMFWFNFNHFLNGIEITIDSFLKLYTRESSKLSVTFKGNSMSGLQVMGILESKVLDFKNVIFIDLNE